jgi:NADPH:quinone reductase-like Zn-dependent oxidoreductase
VPNGGEFHNRWLAGGSRVIRAHTLSRFSKQTLRPFLVSYNPGDLAVLKEMIEAGSLTPVIDRAYSLRETADALRRVGEGHVAGKIVIVI